MTDLRSYLHYFQNLAFEHIDINDFYVMDIGEPLSAMRGTIKFPSLIMNTISGNFSASNLDNTLDDVLDSTLDKLGKIESRHYTI